MTYKQFKDKWIGKPVDFDNFYGAQCVDVYRMYCKEVLDIPQSPSVKGAKNIWTTYLKEHFERISNTPLALPKQGDVIIWDVGTYGHVGICEKATLLTVTCFEENWTELDGSGVSEIRRHNYNNVLGWLSPSGIISEMTDDERRTLQFLKENNAGEHNVREAFGALNDIGGKKEQIEELNKEIKGLKATISDQYKEMDKLHEKYNKLLEDYNVLLPKYEELMKKPPEQIDTPKKLSLKEILILLINKIFSK